MEYLRLPATFFEAAKRINFESFQLPPNEIPQIFIKDLQIINLPPTARVFVRLAAVSGAIAAIMCMYGLEVLYTPVPMEPQEVISNVELSPSYQSYRVNSAIKQNFEMANRQHFIHTLALLAVPFCRWPRLTGTVMTTGIIVFCGSCYYYALTGNKSALHTATYGGYLLILAWILTAI
ncbi:transmembrane protein 256 [Biomphalaria pfeifferi]|uniref:Transmembrane protein 256 n=1 Tax=Biomphalaria pfeifferi TaxID=112525 RepID=A0AAD8BSZ7_BIOPF|nr:transmembrane protein 256 [Biomphalaria pfeifferi]